MSESSDALTYQSSGRESQKRSRFSNASWTLAPQSDTIFSQTRQVKFSNWSIVSIVDKCSFGYLWVLVLDCALLRPFAAVRNEDDCSHVCHDNTSLKNCKKNMLPLIYQVKNNIKAVLSERFAAVSGERTTPDAHKLEAIKMFPASNRMTYRAIFAMQFRHLTSRQLSTQSYLRNA